MKIAVNTRLLLKNQLEGIGVFANETLKRITVNHPEHEFIFLFDRKFDEQFIFSSNINPVVIPPQARHPLLFYAWFEYSVTNALKKYKAHYFLSPDGYLPLSSNVKSLAVIHDLNFEHFPALIPWQNRIYFKYFFPRFAKKATRIATVSQYSKNDIVKQYSISENKIDVVYNAASEDFKPIGEEEKNKTKQKFSENCNYFLFVGATNPRKNISTLLEAFDLFKSENKSDLKLIFAGSRKLWNAEMQRSYENMKFCQDVIFAGRVSQEDLCNITASALALVFVPFFEGFGIPAVEAMNSGVPVIASSVSCLPEVCGDAVCYADPFSKTSVAGAMQKIFLDENLRMFLIEKSKNQAAKYSWDRSAEQLWRSIERSL